MAEVGLLGKAADLVPDALLLVRLDGTVLDCNSAASRLAPGLHAGVSLFEVVADPPDAARRTLLLWARTGQPVMGALTFKGPAGPVGCRCRGGRAHWLPGAADPGPGGAVVEVHATPQHAADQSALLADRFGALNREISYRQRIGAERERLLMAEQRMRSQIQRLYSLSTALASSSTLREVAGVVRAEAAASLGGVTAVLGLFPDQVLPSFNEPRQQREAEAWFDLDSDPGSVLALAARVPGPTLITARGRPLAAFSALAARQDHAAYCIPLELRQQRLGVLAVALPDSPATDLLEHDHVHSVAAQVAQAVARARLFEHEHRLAERLQRSLLPTLPAVARLSVASRYIANTESVRVGGDWYDLFELGPGRVGLAIGDVAGHSLAEATVMAQLQNALRAIAMEHPEPDEALRRLNEYTNTLLPTTLATACYLTLDTRDGRLCFASAGHLPPVLATADGAARLLCAPHGPALGAVPDARYPGAALAMADQDTLLLYTDGLIERRDESLDTGLDRLLATTRRAAGLDPEALCDLLLQDRPGTTWQDDRALLAVRFKQAASP